jgi:hypothetical protein
MGETRGSYAAGLQRNGMISTIRTARISTKEYEACMFVRERAYHM